MQFADFLLFSIIESMLQMKALRYASISFLRFF